MALSSPLSSFHLTPMFLIFCCQAIDSNFTKVCTLKKVSYLANLTSTTTTFESLCFHCITWPCNTCTTIFVIKSIWAYKLVTIFCDSCNGCHIICSLWSYFAPWISCWFLRVNASSFNSFNYPINFFCPPSPSSNPFPRWQFFKFLLRPSLIWASTTFRKLLLFVINLSSCDYNGVLLGAFALIG